MIMAVVYGVAAAFGLLGFWGASRPGFPRDCSRRAAMLVALGWFAVMAVQDAILLDHGFSPFGEETDTSLPLYLFEALHGGAQAYSHALAGGVDIRAAGPFMGQLVSLERVLLSLLPVGAANLVQHLLQTILAFVGTYRLIRSFPGQNRLTALALAGCYSLSNYYVAVVGWQTLGLALGPALAYVLVRRSVRRWYFTTVTAVALLHATSCLPTHTFLGAMGVVVGVAILSDRVRYGRVVAGLAIFGLAMLVNFHAQFWALLQVAPWTGRGQQQQTSLGFRFDHYSNFWLFATLFGVGVLLLLLRQGASRILGLRAGLAGAVCLLGGGVIQLVANHLPGLSSISFSRMGNGFAGVTLVVFALACAHAANPRLLRAVALAVVLFLLTWNKTYRGLEWLSEGGLASLTANRASLAKAPWYDRGEGRRRVITVPYRAASLAPAIGDMDTFDGFVNLLPQSMGIMRSKAFAPGFNSGAFKCCDSYDADSFLNYAPLRLENVGFVLSVVPLVSPHLHQVAGPVGPSPLPHNTDPVLARARAYLAANMNPPPLRVYAIDGPVLPRVYPAREILIVGNDLEPEALADLAVAQADGRKIVVRAADAPADLLADAGLAVESWRLTPDGFEMTVAAPAGGTVVVNAPFLPFWRASVDGAPVRVFPVNLAQTAIMVPAGGRELALHWDRPSLKSLLREHLR